MGDRLMVNDSIEIPKELPESKIEIKEFNKVDFLTFPKFEVRCIGVPSLLESDMKKDIEGNQINKLKEEEELYEIQTKDDTYLFSTTKLMKLVESQMEAPLLGTVMSSALLVSGLLFTNKLLEFSNKSIGNYNFSDLPTSVIFVISLYLLFSSGFLIKSLLKIKKLYNIKKYITKHSKNFLDLTKTENHKSLSQRIKKIKFIV